MISLENTYIYPIQERQNASNTSRHQEVVVSLLNLPCYSHFSCLENFKRSFWKIMIFVVVTRVPNITDFFIEIQNSENDPYFSRILYGVSKFLDFLRILQFFDIFQHFL